MENKKYIDKVLDHLVRNIKIDHKKELVYTPPYTYNSYPSPFQYFLSQRSLLSPSFSLLISPPLLFLFLPFFLLLQSTVRIHLV